MKIQNTNSIGQDALKILVYGESGIGKTSLAATIKEPVLIISAEAGLLSIKNKNIDYVDISIDDAGKPVSKEKRLYELQGYMRMLSQPEMKEKYRWIFLDSITEISQNIMTKVKSEMTEAQKKDTYYLYRAILQISSDLVTLFRDTPHYNVVFTALPSIEKDENGQRFVGVDMEGRIKSEIVAQLDEVFYLHIDKESGERKLLTSRTDKIIAKDRSGKLARIEPANLQLIADKIRG